MTENGRFIPPGASRTAAAAKAGLFPKSKFLAAGSALLTTLLATYWSGSRLSDGLPALFQTSLTQTAHRTLPIYDTLTQSLSSVIPIILCFCLAPFAGAMLGAFIPALIFRKSSGRTAVPIPKIASSKTHFALFRLFAALVFLLIAVYSFRELRIPLTTSGVVRQLGMLCFRITAALGAILTAVGLFELLLVRIAIFKALSLNRSEARQEARATHGNTEVAREQRRRALREILNQ